MKIRLDYTLTIEEWTEAFRASNRSKRRWTSAIVFFSIITALITAVLVLLTMLAMQNEPRMLLGVVIMLGPAFLIALLFWSMMQRKIAALAPVEWKSNPTLRSQCVVTLDDSGVRIDQEFRSADWQWPAFIKFDETANLLLLYISERSFHPIPKRTFVAADLIEFQKFLIKTLPPARASAAGFEVISKAPPPSPIHVQPLESRDFM